MADESPEPMRVHVNETRPLIRLDEYGEPDGTFDAYGYRELARGHHEKNGLGADAVNRLLR